MGSFFYGIRTRLVLACWLALIIFKLLLVIFFSRQAFEKYPERKIGIISFASGDDYSYTGAMDNLVMYGDYFFINQLGDTVRAGRSPHFAIPYWAARNFTSRENAADFLTLINIIIDATAILALALLAFSISNRKNFAFFLALILGALSLYVSNWSYITSPDSLAASLLMIGLFVFWRAYNETEKRKLTRYLFIAAVFFSWAIVSRPFLSLIIAVFALFFIIRRKDAWPLLPRIAAVCSIPLLLMMAPWIIRNYKMTGKFIPFQQDFYAGYGYKPAELEIRKMANAFGDDGATFWDATTMASYFSPEKYKESRFQYPSYILKDKELHSRIESLRTAYLDSTIRNNDAAEGKLRTEAIDIRNDYRDNYMARFYIVNPLKRTFKFWGHSGSYYLASKTTNLMTSVIKVFQSVLYYAALILGTIGLLLFARRNSFGWILIFPVVYFTLFFPMLFALMEPRYAMGFYYIGLLGLVYLINKILNRLRLTVTT